MKKYFHGEIDINWVCSVEGERHISDVNVHAGHNYFHAHSEDDNLYKTFDQVLSKIERQIKRKNNQSKDKLHNTH